jgi:Raf kinase inhibitor-like YbhB/YbcL family protein
MYFSTKQYSSFILSATLVACVGMYTVSYMRSATNTNKNFVLTSTDFKDGEVLAKAQAYTRCGGENKSPALSWSGAPADTKSFALTVEDPDAPRGTFIHWVLFNIPHTISSLSAGVAKAEMLAGALQGAQQGVNDFNETGYDGPCPPSGIHHYIFTLYALDTVLDESKLASPVTYKDLVKTIKPHVLGQAKITGLYSASQK